MNKEMITTTQGISIAVMFIIGSAVILNPGAEAKQDVWISIFIAAVITLPTVALYARILSLHPGKDLYDILQLIFGRLSGKIIGFIYIWFSFHLGAMVIRNFTEFIQVVSLPETPQFVVAGFTVLLCIWMVKAGIEVMGRWANFVLPCLSVLIVGLITLSLTEADINNLKPVLYNGIKPVISGAYAIFSFPFAETIVFTMVFSSARGVFNAFKVYAMGSLLGFLIFLTVYVRNYLVLGVEVVTTLYFPSYAAVSLIDIGEFLQRIEVIISVIFMFCGIVKIGVCLYAATNGAAKVFGFDSHRILVVPIGFLMMLLSCFIWKNTMEMFESALITPIYKIPFVIVLPLILWISAEIRMRSKKRYN